MGEAREVRLRRLGIRSWRRGTREMDLILGGFADAALAGLDEAEIEQFEALLSENDHDLYRWIAGSEDGPKQHQEIVRRIRVHHSMG
ncbi:MAG: succinate dehydrogenase assembly factor 2 [Amaricoccus sp.]|mgnify:CR=1 FL=1